MTVSVQDLEALCREAGASIFAILKPGDLSPEDLRARYAHWFSVGNGGALDYVDSRLEAICNPFGVRPWARSAFILAFAPHHLADSPLRKLPLPVQFRGRISGYALREDYHVTGHRILEMIASGLGENQVEICVDSSPVPEKDMARVGELGGTGPNSLVRVHGFGCRMHLAVMFTSLDLPRIRPVSKAEIPCADCMKCRKNCPNHAMAANGTLIVRKCRSWLAGQKRGALNWQEQLELGGNLFGCSICSSQCPEDSLGDEDLMVDSLEILRMPTGELRRLIATTPLNHSGATVFKRNAAAAVGIQATSEERAALKQELLANCSSPAIRETICNWPD